MEEIHDLYSSPNIIHAVKSRMRWVEYAACMGDRNVHTRLWWGDLRERGHLEDLGIDGRITAKWITKKWYGEA